MTFETRKVHVPIWGIFVICLLLLTALLAVWYFYLDPNDAKLVGMVGGLITGIVVYLLTFVTLLNPLRELEKFREMGIRGLLSNRHDQAYYRRIVGQSRRRVDVMGASCTRFLQDFLDTKSEDKALVDALNASTELQVRLLIPNNENMNLNARSKVQQAMPMIDDLRQRFGDRVELRRFDSKAHHSFVLTDKDIVAGPIFEEGEGKHAPATHASADTIFGQKYSGHFDRVWEASPAQT